MGVYIIHGLSPIAAGISWLHSKFIKYETNQQTLMKGLRVRNVSSHQRAVQQMFWSQALLSNLGINGDLLLFSTEVGSKAEARWNT